MRSILLLVLASVSFLLVSCSSTSPRSSGRKFASTRISSVRTTAYTHSESDHVQYGAKTAVGTPLKYGTVRSAATDWSVYPVGTVFQIEGQPYLYEVDDYGSALVGTNTIDLYKPSRSEMNNWGTRNVNIRVVKWGSFSRSLAIMRGRERNDHVRKMVQRIHRSS
jgi:3D (Asp-Asp-Asp) domain-containing protein